MQPLTAMDVLNGLNATEASHSGQRPVLEGNIANPDVDSAATEAGPSPTLFGQLHQQQAPLEASQLEEKRDREPKPAAYLSEQQERTTGTRGPAIPTTAAATQQRTAHFAPPPRPAAQPPIMTTRQNPIITNAMSAVEEHSPWLRDIPSVPVYSPTAEEWHDPLAYIRSIQAEAGKYGACVVKAPITPAVPAALLLKDLKFTTRLQKVKDDPWGKTWEEGIKFWDSGRKCTLLEYAKFADNFARRKLGIAAELPTATVEAMYWREKEGSRVGGKVATVEYGNDVEGSAFHPQDPLGQTNWNLNSFSDLPGSALRHCLSPAPGVTTPMLYIGMLYATFAWHVEDHFMYSINYSHAGASKVWYSVPASAADDLETTARETVYREPCTTMIEEHGASLKACNEAVAEALAGKTTTMSPRYLVKKGVPVYRAVQEAGSYVITFPRSYHSGFSTGFNLGEAVNFVLSDWWPFGEHARRLYKSINRQQIISHEQVLCDDASALAAKLVNLDATQQLSREDTPVAVAFVGMMQHLHCLRENFQTKKVVQVATCSPDIEPNAAEMRQSIPCTRCSHQNYLVSAVVDARKAQSEWEHVCLECAAAAEGDVTGPSASSASHLMVYVKPSWSTMESRAKLFASLLAKQQQMDKDHIRSAGGEAAVVHQRLSLEGCSKHAIANLATLCRYSWTELNKPVLDVPYWVGKQPETVIEGELSAGAADGSFGGDVDMNQAPNLKQLVDEKEKHTRLRKRITQEDDEDWDSFTEEEDEEEKDDEDRAGDGRSMRRQRIFQTRKKSAPISSLPTMKRHKIVVEKDQKAETPPQEHPEPSRVYLQNFDVVSPPLVLPPPPPATTKHTISNNNSTTATEFIQHVAKIFIAETSKATGGYIHNNNPEDHELRPAPGSLPQLRTYYLPLPSPSGSTKNIVVVAAAAYHVAISVLQAGCGVANILSRWTRAVAATPGIRKQHILCVAPLLYRCDKWKSSKTIPSTFILTLEQCTVFYLFALKGSLPSKSKSTAEGRRNRMYRTMVSVWGEEAVVKMIENVAAVDFVSNTPLSPELQHKLSEIQAGNDGDDDLGAGDHTAAAAVPEDQVVNNTESLSLQRNVGPEVPVRSTSGATASITGAAAAATPPVGGNNDKKFTPFPSLFNVDNNSSLPLTSSKAVPGALHMDFSAVADPEEIDVEIEAENNRSGGAGGSDGDGGRSGSGQKGTTTSPISAAPTPFTIEELPPLEEDVLELMEAEFHGVSAANVAPPLPLPALVEQFVSQHIPMPVAQPQPQYNIYTSLDPIFITEPRPQQQQLENNNYYHPQHLYQPMLVGPPAPAPVVSLQNPQILLSGNNWNGAAPDNEYQMEILPLYAHRPPGTSGASSGGRNSLSTGWNAGEMRRW